MIHHGLLWKLQVRIRINIHFGIMRSDLGLHTLTHPDQTTKTQFTLSISSLLRMALIGSNGEVAMRHLQIWYLDDLNRHRTIMGV